MACMDSVEPKISMWACGLAESYTPPLSMKLVPMFFMDLRSWSVIGWSAS